MDSEKSINSFKVKKCKSFYCLYDIFFAIC